MIEIPRQRSCVPASRPSTVSQTSSSDIVERVGQFWPKVEDDILQII